MKKLISCEHNFDNCCVELKSTDGSMIAIDTSIITASVFISLLQNLCKRPLMGRTVRKEENLVGKAKGKIVFNKNIRFNTLRGRDDRLYCRYLQYTEDIIENQILKAALKKAEMFLNQYFRSVSGCKNTFRDMISYCNNALAHISHRKITRFDLNGIKTTGVYVSYKPVVNAAKMVLNEITMAANGSTTITSYVIPYAISIAAFKAISQESRYQQICGCRTISGISFANNQIIPLNLQILPNTIKLFHRRGVIRKTGKKRVFPGKQKSSGSKRLILNPLLPELFVLQGFSVRKKIKVRNRLY